MATRKGKGLETETALLGGEACLNEWRRNGLGRGMRRASLVNLATACSSHPALEVDLWFLSV